MADAVVDRDAGREGDALHQLLVLLEGLAGLLHQPLVTLDAPARHKSGQFQARCPVQLNPS